MPSKFLQCAEAIHNYCGGNLTVAGERATAGIFATYPAPYLSLPAGFIDQVARTDKNQGLSPHTVTELPHLFGVIPVCVLGVWHGHAAALPAGSGRPEEQTCPCGQRANHGGTPGVAHWDLAGQQQWLRHQPHQRHWTEDLHRHGRLGSRRLQVRRRSVRRSILFVMSSSFMDLFFLCQDKGFLFVLA